MFRFEGEFTTGDIMKFTVQQTKRIRRRKINGRVVEYERYVLNCRHPKTGARRQEFFERQKDAQARKNDLITKLATGAFREERKVPTLSQVVDHWLQNKATSVKPSTLEGYRVVVQHI